MKINKASVKKAAVAVDDDETPQVSKKMKKATAELHDDDEATDEDAEVLAESRPKTGKDRLRVPKVSQKLVSQKRRVVVEDDEDAEDDELTQEEMIAYHEDELAKLKRYGGVKLLPRKKGAFGKHDKKGFRKASVARAAAPDTEELTAVTMLKTCDPAPRVGNVSVVVDHGHEKLVKNEKYLLPRAVALHLAETRYAILHDDAD